jgi:DNA-binding transcriptional ArsR family regulator
VGDPLSQTKLISQTNAAVIALRCEGLANPVRLRILHFLLTHPKGEANPQEIERSGCCNRHQPSISFHIKKLLAADLIEFEEKRGLYRYYRAKPEHIAELRGLLGILTPEGVK